MLGIGCPRRRRASRERADAAQSIMTPDGAAGPPGADRPVPALSAAGAVPGGGRGLAAAAIARETYWARPVPSLGDASARLLLVGLAPAAHGGNRTGRMFTGDLPGGSGEWVARAFHAHGFATQPTSHDRGDGYRLVEAYITAALHCVPPDNRPAPPEIRRCARYLQEELPRLARVRVVVGLGRIGFDAYLGAAAAIGLPVPRPRPDSPTGRPSTCPGACLAGDLPSEPSEHPDGEADVADVRGRLRRGAAVAWARGAVSLTPGGRSREPEPRDDQRPPAAVKTDRGSPSHRTPSSAPTSGWTFR